MWIRDGAVVEGPHDDIAAVPLAGPLVAGPGAITAVILLASRPGGDWLDLLWVIGVVASSLLVTLAILLIAVPIDRLIGKTVRTVVTRLLGVILAALAVQFVADGVTALMS